jgi:hypothetical protein
MSTEQDLEQMAPHIEAIATDIQAFADDTNGKFHSRTDEVLEFVAFFREGLRTCCAFHRFQDVASMQMTMLHANQQCQCDDILNHQLLAEIINIIGKHMLECVKEASFARMLAARVN